ncbi:MAG TPA: J domain-containing protein [Marmoricola sp.]|jgi:Mce-associated membrane protein|nr:J domain-containing protein [Marmoricola sp.]
MTTPNPTWYDILGVPRDASPEQVKAAWRTATDKFEPGSGSGQFRLFNEAADVLLDPVRRAEYDAGLAAEPVTVQEPPAPAAPGTDADTPGAPAIEPADGPDDPDAEPMTGRSWVLPVLAALTALALVAVVVAAGLLWNRSSDAGIDLVDGVTEGEIPARVAAGDSAQSAAARALVAVLSYDYRRMEADKERALQYLTPSFGKEFAATFDKLLTDAGDDKPGNAEKTKTVVKADVLQTGVMNPEASTTSKVRVLAFVNQAATKGEGSPTIFQNRVAVTMVKRGGKWLIDGLTSY